VAVWLKEKHGSSSINMHLQAVLRIQESINGRNQIALYKIVYTYKQP